MEAPPNHGSMLYPSVARLPPEAAALAFLFFLHLADASGSNA